MQHVNGIQKGLLTILKERGKHLNDTGHQLSKVCRSCLSKTPHSDRENKTERCCAVYVLSQETDFKEQKPWLVESVENLGFRVIFIPSITAS
jgi:hypothetical protein